MCGALIVFGNLPVRLQVLNAVGSHPFNVKKTILLITSVCYYSQLDDNGGQVEPG